MHPDWVVHKTLKTFQIINGNCFGFYRAQNRTISIHFLTTENIIIIVACRFFSIYQMLRSQLLLLLHDGKLTEQSLKCFGFQ